MNTGTRVKYAAGAALLVGVLTSGCASGGGQDPVAEDCVPAHDNIETIEPGVLQIGILDLPPLVTTSGPDGYGGIDGEIIAGFAAAECLQVEPNAAAPATLVQAVEQGRFDTSLGGWYRSEAREQVVSMGAPLYLDQIVLVSAEGISSFDDLVGLQVGAVEGLVYTEDIRNLVGGELKTYAEAAQMQQDYEAGRIEAYVDQVTTSLNPPDGAVVSVVEPDPRVPSSLKPAQSSLPFNKSAVALREAFDDYVEMLQESGELGRILEKHGMDPALADVGEPYFV